MEMLQQFATHTPVWVWVLLVFLVTRGVKGLKPAETTLGKLAIIPVVFTAWGLWALYHHYQLSFGSVLQWLAGIAAGALVGWWLLRRLEITVDPASGRMHRAADYSLLPLLLVTFAVKYGFQAALTVDPALSGNSGFRMADLLLSGGFTGIFIGKFLRYARARSEGMRATAPG